MHHCWIQCHLDSLMQAPAGSWCGLARVSAWHLLLQVQGCCGAVHVLCGWCSVGALPRSRQPGLVYQELAGAAAAGCSLLVCCNSLGARPALCRMPASIHGKHRMLLSLLAPCMHACTSTSIDADQDVCTGSSVCTALSLRRCDTSSISNTIGQAVPKQDPEMLQEVLLLTAVMHT